MAAHLMDEKQLAFALDSQRFFRGAQWLSYLPGANVRLARRWGRLASPYKADLPALIQSYAQAYGASAQVAHDLSQQWLASHGLFARSIFDYHRMDADWVRQHVQTEQPDVLQSLREQGGLVLTYHSHHHNTLGIVLGQSGIPTWGVAATEKASPMAPYTGRFMRIINGQSEAKFAGGRYLFTDEPRALLRGLKQAFKSSHAVVSLCDNPIPQSDHPPVRFMGRCFHVGAGVVEQALVHNAPITLALLCPDLLGKYRLYLQKLHAPQSPHEVLQAYFDFLAKVVQQTPWAWQGWHWYSGLAVCEHPASP
jgi:lauroyl/myristoyl acyltransferase